MYDEEDDGFLFKRVKTTKEEVKPSAEEESRGQRQKQKPAQPIEQEIQPSQIQNAPDGNIEPKPQPRKTKKRLSFSTPKSKEAAPVRRSKRLSKENEQQGDTPAPTRTTNHLERPTNQEKEAVEQDKESTNRPRIQQQRSQKPSIEELPKASPPKAARVSPSKSPKEHMKETVSIQHEDHSATKIALPFADTPVIKRNKAMREGKSEKGERRSSLGTRGRRASSLIETGSSNGEKSP